MVDFLKFYLGFIDLLFNKHFLYDYSIDLILNKDNLMESTFISTSH